jgi:RHS repeat-associated protein
MTFHTGNIMRRESTIKGLLAIVISLCLGAGASAKESTLGLPKHPSDTDLFMVRVFEEPLVPMSQKKVAGENEALGQALEDYAAEGVRGDIRVFDEFLKEYPTSRWNAALQTNLGIIRRKGGYFSDALDRLAQAWKLSKQETALEPKALADRALGEYADLNARFGRVDAMQALFAEAEGRDVPGSAQSLLTGAREGLWRMTHQPERGFRCGPYAINEILAEKAGKYQADPAVDATSSTDHGTNLKMVQALAKKVGLDYVPAKRIGNAPWPLPCVVHWKVGHFAAITRKVDELYLIKDATYEKDLLVSDDALDTEATGYALIPASAVKEGQWVKLSDKEAGKVWGKGGASVFDPKACEPCNRAAHASCQTCPGMPTFDIFLMQAALRVADTPVTYQPPFGPSLSFQVTYNQLQPGQPQNFNFTNFGPLWGCGFVGYLQTASDATSPTYTNVTVYPPGGGEEDFSYQGTDLVTARSAKSIYTGAVLVPKGAAGYERQMPDGSREVYGKADTMNSRWFLTALIDPQGNKLQVNYDANYRITGIVDASNQTTTISYKSNTAGDPGFYKVYRVSDPYATANSHFAEFGYDASWRLTSIKDAVGMTSYFEYSTDGFVTKMTTPYGPTQFYKYTPVEDADYGHGVLVIHPDGSKEVVESYMGHTLTTYYWDRKAMAMSPGNRDMAQQTGWLLSNKGQVMVDVPKWTKRPYEGQVDYTYWGGTENGVFENPDDPSQQTGTHYHAGLYAGPKTISRSTSMGTQTYYFEYNNAGNVTKSVDPRGRTMLYKYAGNDVDLLEVRGGNNDLLARMTYDNAHRPLTVTDASGRMTQYHYNAQEQVDSITNAKSEVTTLAYTGPTGTGTGNYLTQIDGPLPGANDLTKFTYSQGNVRTVTRVEGPNAADQYTLTYDYDGLNRVTKVTYPDTTYEQTDYYRLNVARKRDRLGQWTYYTYDALGKLASMRDPAGRTTLYEWCRCGKLQKLTDPMGRVTKWAYNEDGQLLSKTYPGSSSPDETYTYEPDTGRLATFTDKIGNVTTYAYNLDNSVDHISFATQAPTVATPSISYTYDPNYPRLKTAKNSYGTYTYNYKPYVTDFFGGAQNGIGQIESITNDALPDNSQTSASGTISYLYDELGRVVNRKINGATNDASWTYDAAGRLDSWTNPLGTFDPTYVNPTYGSSRVDTITLPLGLSTAYQWEPNTGDFRLKEIKHLDPSANVIEKFNYVTDPLSEIKEWTSQKGTAVGEKYALGYDPASQLTSGKLTNVSTGALLHQYYYGYDNAGNRVSQQADTAATTTQFNDLNQIQTTSAGGKVRFKGTLNEPGKVTVSTGAISNQPAWMSQGGTQFETSLALSPGTNTVTVVAKDASNNTRTNTYQVTVPSSSGKTFTYDLAGNMTSDGSSTYTWDVLNQLVKITYSGGASTEFTYDALGRRVKIVEKNSSGTVTETRHFVWEGMSIVEQRDGSGNLVKRYYDGGYVIGTSATPAASEKFVYLKDHLGSVRAVYGSSGISIYQDFDLWGNLTLTAGTSNTPADFGYTGHYFHAGSGLFLAPYRAYSAAQGRWISRDPIEEGGGINLYQYVLNNTLSKIDRMGLVDSNHFAENDRVNSASNGFQTSDYDYGAHGVRSPNKPAQGILDDQGQKNKKEGPVLMPRDVADQIRADPNYKKGQPVTLMACSTGLGGNKSFAQKLANLLGVPVTAPLGDITIDNHGNTRIGNNPMVPAGESPKGNPGWNTFMPK